MTTICQLNSASTGWRQFARFLHVMYTYICMYVCTYVCVYVCMYAVCTYVCMYVRMYVRMYVCRLHSLVAVQNTCLPTAWCQ